MNTLSKAGKHIEGFVTTKYSADCPKGVTLYQYSLPTPWSL